MEQTLLLNATYEPLKVVHWQKAITLWCQGKVEVISVYDREVRSVSISFKLPSVIRLLRYIRIKRRFDYVPFKRSVCSISYTCRSLDSTAQPRAELDIIRKQFRVSRGEHRSANVAPSSRRGHRLLSLV